MFILNLISIFGYFIATLLAAFIPNQVVKDGKFSGEDPGLLLASSDLLDNGAEDSPEQPMLSSEALKNDVGPLSETQTKMLNLLALYLPHNSLLLERILPRPNQYLPHATTNTHRPFDLSVLRRRCQGGGSVAAVHLPDAPLAPGDCRSCHSTQISRLSLHFIRSPHFSKNVS